MSWMGSDSSLGNSNRNISGGLNGVAVSTVETTWDTYMTNSEQKASLGSISHSLTSQPQNQRKD